MPLLDINEIHCKYFLQAITELGTRVFGFGSYVLFFYFLHFRFFMVLPAIWVENVIFIKFFLIY